jgi:lysophospholipase L1-like esterase
VTSSTAIPVTFADPIVTGGKTPLTAAVCTPSSGSLFPVGSTTVTCRTTDALQRSASCTFAVQVAPPPTISLQHFVAFGDSLTWGQDGQDDPTATPLVFKPFVRVLFPYPARLLQYLDARYTTQVSQLSVLNEGCQGETLSVSTPSPCEGAPSAQARFGRVMDAGHYDAVLIMEGSNDVNLIPGDFGAEGRALTVLQVMIEYARNVSGARPYLATLPPMNPAGDPSRTRGATFVNDFNVHLAALAASEGVPLIDVNGNIPLSLLAPDGLHLRQAGYDKIAQLFLEKLEATAETSPVRTTSLARRLR